MSRSSQKYYSTFQAILNFCSQISQTVLICELQQVLFEGMKNFRNIFCFQNLQKFLGAGCGHEEEMRPLSKKCLSTLFSHCNVIVFNTGRNWENRKKSEVESFFPLVISSSCQEDLETKTEGSLGTAVCGSY